MYDDTRWGNYVWVGVGISEHYNYTVAQLTSGILKMSINKVLL